MAIPLVLFQRIRNEKKALMPHDIHALMMRIVITASEIDRARDNWQLVLSWCLMAAQRSTGGNSHLSLAVEAVTEGDDEDFVRWIDQWLDSTFGIRPSR